MKGREGRRSRTRHTQAQRSTALKVDLKPRILSTMITEDDSTASLGQAMEVVGYFELHAAKAKAIAKEVTQSVATWGKEAFRQRLSKTEIDRMASAIEQSDLTQVLSK